MTRYILGCVLMIVVAGSAGAQLPPHMQPPPQTPALSNYTYLLDRNRSTAASYLLYTQPAIQNQNQFNALQQQVQGLQNAPGAVAPGTGNELITGKSFGYFTHRGYFLNQGGFGKANYLTGQYGTIGSNSVNQTSPGQGQQPQPYSNNSIMPYRR
jgi:hypothetical protein